MPTRIRILGKGTDRKAVVEFDNTDSANHCYKVWCRSVTMRTSWDQGYLLFKKKSLKLDSKRCFRSFKKNHRDDFLHGFWHSCDPFFLLKFGFFSSFESR